MKENWDKASVGLWSEEPGASQARGGPPLEELLNGIGPPASTEAEISSGSSVSDWILRNAFTINCGMHRTWKTCESKYNKTSTQRMLASTLLSDGTNNWKPYLGSPTNSTAETRSLPDNVSCAWLVYRGLGTGSKREKGSSRYCLIQLWDTCDY